LLRGRPGAAPLRLPSRLNALSLKKEPRRSGASIQRQCGKGSPFPENSVPDTVRLHYHACVLYQSSTSFLT
jgi:hypothetical protein